MAESRRTKNKYLPEQSSCEPQLDSLSILQASLISIKNQKTNCSWPSLFHVVKIGKLKFKIKSTTFKFENVSHGHGKNQPEKTKKSKNSGIRNSKVRLYLAGQSETKNIHISVCIEHNKLPGYFLMNVECRTKAVKKSNHSNN